MSKHAFSLLSAAPLRRVVLGTFLLLACALPVRADDPSVVYRKSIDGVVWIRNYLPNKKVCFGTGFLIDSERRLVVTNWHVTEGEETMDVFFPVRDKDGRLIDDRAYYAKNMAHLKKVGSYSVGRMTAKSKGKDLAVIRLDRLPPKARPLALATTEPKKGAALHVLGHPAGRKLWRWCGGWGLAVADYKYAFKDGHQVDFRAVHSFSSTFSGNSGGPVLDDEGKVVGVHQSSSAAEGGMYATAVHASEVKKLLDTVQLFKVFSVVNKTNATIPYQVKWGDGVWQEGLAKPGWTYTHWWSGKGGLTIRFKHSGDQKTTQVMKTYTKWMGDGGQATARDAWEYYFTRSDGNRLNLTSYPNGNSR